MSRSFLFLRDSNTDGRPRGELTQSVANYNGALYAMFCNLNEARIA